MMLKYDEFLSCFGFKINSRRYTTAANSTGAAGSMAGTHHCCPRHVIHRILNEPSLIELHGILLGGA